MYIITIKHQDVQTRFVIGCLDQAKKVADQFSKHGLHVQSLVLENKAPERSEIEMRRAMDIMHVVFGETETKQ